ncbi:MAG TPA: HAD hydrolase family protein, partial [Candidatus Eremiobacteraceae bacterium]|nr:HAD hydrolase family protein [Candidatus Eremiobacteraceae bacterium]
RQYLEVTDPHADKGTALRWVAAQSRIDLRDTAAIGDSDNDVPMFASAGRSFAVSTGTPLAKARASSVVGPQGVGVAEAIDALLGAATPEAG